VRIANATRGSELAGDVRVARSFWTRLVGLLGRSSLPDGEGLLIEPCSSVHTAFMRFSIDVVYVDKSQRVVKAVRRLRPFRMSAVLRGGHAVIELPPGTIERTGTAPGDQLSYQD
jgi:uncharacterized membrane protein (UPF0127 family)